MFAAAAAGLLLAGAVGTTAAEPTPKAAAPAGPAAVAAPFAGGPAGCTVKDPTTSGCVTPTTAHALAEIDRVFGGYRKGPKIRSAGCWDKHAWNPTSDHPKGKGCDLFFGKAGVFPSGAPLANGWELANWLRSNADGLHVNYVIWQGRIWTNGRPDVDGWGRAYTGGGIYNARSATGGHFDHVHVSFKQ